MPIALTIAGSDSSGGAGIQADLKTFAAFGVYGASVLTALTAQNTQGVGAIHDVPPAFIESQIDAVATDLAVGAVKTGMLGRQDAVVAVARAVAKHGLTPLVVDPVMVAASGDPLLAPDAVDALRHVLIPRAALVTPNLAEAAALLDAPLASGIDDMKRQAVALLALGPGAALVKGGHGTSEAVVDVLAAGDDVWMFERPRLHTRSTHGTGCTLSAAITALLALDVPMAAAVERAKLYVWRAIESAAEHPVGKGNGPVDHLFAIRSGSAPA